jgi:hypothetical protein
MSETKGVARIHPPTELQFSGFFTEKIHICLYSLAFTFKSLMRSSSVNTGMMAAHSTLGIYPRQCRQCGGLFNQDNFERKHETKKATWKPPGHSACGTARWFPVFPW